MSEILEVVQFCVDLAVQIHECVETARANSEAKKVLAERIGVIRIVLLEIKGQHGAAMGALSKQALECRHGHSDGSAGYVSASSSPQQQHVGAESMAYPLERALSCVNGQLQRAAELFAEMEKAGRLRKFWEATGKNKELDDLDKSLQGVVGVLQLAQATLLAPVVNQTKQTVEDNATMLKGLHQNQLHMAEEMEQLKQALAEKLAFSGESGELQRRSSSEMVSGNATRAAPKDFVRYNREMLQFLKEQMEGFMSIFSEPEFYRVARPNGWVESMANTMDALKLGGMLIDRHKKPFKLDTFYKVSETQSAVNMVCGTINMFLEEWGIVHVMVIGSVPQEKVQADRDQLREYLAFVLMGGSEGPAFKGLPESVNDEWRRVKEKTDKLRKEVEVLTTDEKIVVDKQIAGSVYEGTWDGKPVAVKKPRKDNARPKLDLEDFAQFFTEAVALTQLRSDRIVRFKAATESGMLVMERGIEQLLKWCESQEKDSLGSLAEGLQRRLRLLLQAAQALNDVHKRKFVHRDVSTGKFVVFGSEGSPQVKIVGFGLAIVRTGTESQTLRRHIDDTPAWVAPEIFEGKRYSFASDIYSFGIVLYHVVTGVHPYGKRTSTGELMRKKEAGHRPCTLDENLRAPSGLEDVLLKSTEKNPEERYASMQEVCGALEAVISNAGWSA